MKVAVFSDVHGNAVALEAVLADLAAQRPDLVVCGGDLAFGGPEPEGSVARVRGLGVPCVRGNTDEWVTDDVGAPDDPISRWTRRRLSESSRAWLGSLPFEHRAGDLVIVHATPWSVSDVIPVQAEPAVLRRALSEARASAVVYGHIHQAWIGQPPGGGLVVNSGSVGFPFDGDPRAAYAVLERTPAGWTAVIRRVAYDLERAAGAFPSDHPDAATWARRLRTGTRA